MTFARWEVDDVRQVGSEMTDVRWGSAMTFVRAKRAQPSVCQYSLAPNIAVPMRTMFEPSSTARGQSPDIPIER